LQKQGNRKTNWQFICQGNFIPEQFQETLGLHHAEIARGPHNYLYCYMKIEKKRFNQIEKAFAEHDRTVPESMRIKLTNLPGESAMIGFGHGKEYEKHVIYKKIKELQQQGCPSYKVWDASVPEGSNHNQDWRVQNKVMQEKPNAFGGAAQEDASVDGDASDGELPDALQGMSDPTSSTETNSRNLGNFNFFYYCHS
jgi:hypothetical protein